MSVEKSEHSWRERRRGATPPPAPPPERKSWRKKKAAAPISGAHARRGIEPTDPRRALYRQRIMIGLLGMVFASAAVALIIYLLIKPRQTPLVALRMTDYPSALQLPPNAYAEEDYERFRTTFSLREVDGKEGLRQANRDVGLWMQPSDDSGLQRSSAVQTLLRPLDQKGFLPGGPKKDVILLYVSAHGVVDEKGSPCLLMGDASPTDTKTWLRVEEIFDALHNHPRFGEKEGVKKVLLFDANRIVTQENIGLLHNGFAAALEQLVRDKGYSDLFIINSTSPGEVAWSSPLLQGSLFGFYVAEGLNGQADTRRNRRVTLAEFADYLRTAVSSWARWRRDAPQHPKLLTAAEHIDFPIVYVTRYVSLSEGLEQRAKEQKTAQKIRERAAQLRQLTEKYHNLREQEVFVRAPWEWAQMETDLTRLDQLLLAGSAYANDYASTVSRVSGALAELEAETPLGGHSLEFERRASRDLDEQTAQRVQAWEKPNFDEWKDPLDHRSAVALAWQWVQGGADAARLAPAMSLINRFPPAQPPALLEAHWLELLAGHPDPQAAAAQILDSIVTRTRAESAAFPPDLRSTYWITSTLAEADRQRRTAEDKLLIASGDALNEASELFTAARANYQQADEQAKRIAEAYRLRDEAYALAPALVRWATLRTQFGESDPQLFSPLGTMLTQLQQLAGRLEPAGNRPRSAVEEIERAAEELRLSLTALKRDYYETCRPLSSAEVPDQELTRKLLEALSVPSLDARIQRAQLRERLFSLLLDDTGDISDSAMAPNAPAKKPNAEQPAVEAKDRLLVALASQPLHPLLLLTDRSGLAGGSAFSDRETVLQRPDNHLKGDDLVAGQHRFLAEQGERLRQRMRVLESDCDALTRSTLEAASTNGPQQGDRLRAGVAAADRLQRSSAALIGRATWRKGRDPGSVLRALDQRWFYLWQAHRTLEDFWGPADEGTYYFAEIADDYLRRAQVSGNVVEAAGCWFGDHDLLALESQRIEAAREGVFLDPTDIILHPGETIAPHQLALSAAAHLPGGEAALVTRKPWENLPIVPSLTNSDRDENNRVPITVGDRIVEPALIDQRFRYSDLQGTTRLETVALYRGHAWSNQLYVRTPGEGHEVIVQRVQPTVPTVRVEGADPRPMAIMFVFDCSYSMADQVDVEGGKAQRFQPAKNALLAVLQRLPEANYQIGLVLYGHRVAVDGRGTRYVRSDPHPDLVPPRGLPLGSDVQIVRPLEPWDRGQNPAASVYINQVMNKVGPFGKTPLYFAIKKAIAEGLNGIDPKVYSRHVIVITDGENEQEPTETNRADFTELADLQQFLGRNRDVRVDILGFDLPNTPTLEGLCSRTGGRYIPVRRRQEVIQTIQDMVRPGEFSIPGPGETAFDDAYALGQLWTARNWDGVETPYDVRVRAVTPEVRPQQIRLEGGETLEMQVQRSNLVFKRYEPADESMRARTQSGDLDVIARVAPRESGNGVRFPIAIQNHDTTRFTPRPRHFWAEVKPMGELANTEKDWPTFVFYDLQFENQRPVPELVLSARNWPELANLAEVRVWLRMTDDLKPTDEFPVPLEMESTSFTSKGVSGVEFQVERMTVPDSGHQLIRVREIHEGNANTVDLNRLRVQMVPPPDEIKHQYITESKRVVHEFTYASGRKPEKIQVTTREQLIGEGAVSLDKPLRVRTQRR